MSISALGRAAVFGVALSLAPYQAAAGDDGEPSGEVEEMAREGLEQLMRALELFIGSIPLYEVPEVLENGDIIIRRQRPDAPAEPPKTKPDQEPPAMEKTSG